ALIFTDTDSGGIIHIANIKGGVGKSTVATNLAASLSRRGPTLIVDLDVQGSASVALGFDTETDVKSSWELFRKRFPSAREQWLYDFFQEKKQWALSRIFRKEIEKKPEDPGVVKIQPCLDLIPANSELFKNPSRIQIENLIYNLAIYRNFYKYIILDTPSVWNDLTRALFINSDLNLIPVTLNALSTKSLRDYLSNVRMLAQKNPGLRIRIVKNEVFGTDSSKLVGKTRTMSENRKYLENLCEQVSFYSGSGISLLPQSIMFDLEIPESAIVRNAQDEGKSVYHYQQHGKVAKAFEELADRVQCVLNTPVHGKNLRSNLLKTIPDIIAAAVLVGAFVFNMPVHELNAPAPLAPQQLAIPETGTITHTFSSGESVYKIAKYAICHFRAVVPSPKEVNDYSKETVDIYNLTRSVKEPKLSLHKPIPSGFTLTFYPPANIRNENEKMLVPVYDFFVGLVEDKYAYVTGDWCERGLGGGQPHYGIDVAGSYGAKVYSPIDGKAFLRTNSTMGRSVGIVKNEALVCFMHLDERTVKDGQAVKQGQVIGTIGMTGRTSGPHVHIGYGIQSQ
ncbi:MAG: AAA family ATPase, partial [Fibrobacter sp.]|nr:AAA family ATPase [Fibrobacter sp.]